MSFWRKRLLYQTHLSSDLDGNSVQLTATSGSDATTSLVSGVLEPAKLLELLNKNTNVLSAGLLESVGADTTALVATEDASKGTNTDITGDVDTAEDGSSTVENPIDIEGAVLGSSGSLDESHPGGDIELARLLEVLGESLNEGISGDILNGMNGALAGELEQRGRHLRQFKLIKFQYKPSRVTRPTSLHLFSAVSEQAAVIKIN